MKINARLSIIAFLLISVAFIFTNCSDDNPSEPPPPVLTKIEVKSVEDSSRIAKANVVLYDATSGESVTRTLTSNDGIAKFENLPSGTYYTEITADGFHESPPKNVSPIPFTISSNKEFSQTYYLDKLEGTFGKIEGNVTPNNSGFLLVAYSMDSNNEYHSYSGPDGYFVIYNIPYGSYKVNGMKSGYQSTENPEVLLTSTSTSANIDIILTEIIGSQINGMVTFRAVENGIVDISLLDAKSMSVVNGLTTKIDSNKLYSIESIPVGEYKAWASYENDGYVMDPDWIFKNPSALNVSIINDTTVTLDFSVTDAVEILTPTNPDYEMVPDTVDSITPTFSWESYPQTKEYIIEVRDINGRLIWGGFNESGEVLHSKITKDKNSIEFNFDGSALEELKSGDIYQWRLYSDGDANHGVQLLLSSSEDLKGLFIVE